MIKAELINRVVKDLYEDVDVVKPVVDAVLDHFMRALRRGERVAINGLGTFTKVTRAARQGRNPRTNEVINIPEKCSIKFKPAVQVIRALNGEEPVQAEHEVKAANKKHTVDFCTKTPRVKKSMRETYKEQNEY